MSIHGFVGFKPMASKDDHREMQESLLRGPVATTRSFPRQWVSYLPGVADAFVLLFCIGGYPVSPIICRIGMMEAFARPEPAFSRFSRSTIT